MTRIGNTDQVMALIRNQLQRMTKRERSAKSGKAQRNDSHRLSQKDRINALNAIEGLSDGDFAHSIIRALLSEEFGEQVSNSPGFQELVDRTLSVMKADPQVAALLRQLRSDL